jgi:hypothetical protein
MANRAVEVLYKLKDLFTGQVKKIRGSYDRLRDSSRRTAAGVEKDNERMSSSFGRLGAGVRAASVAFAAAFTGRAVARGVSSVADELDRLGKTAGRLDIDPNTLAALEFAADRAGVSVSKMSAAIETLQKRTGEALGGIGRAKIAFESLGISVEQFVELDAEQQLITIANALQGVASEEERAAIAAQLFSKANVDLLNVLNDGGAVLQRRIAEGKELRTVTKEATEAAADYNDALTNLSATLEGVKFGTFTPAIEYLNQQMQQLGLGADPVKNLEEQLRLARVEFDALARAGLQGSQAFETASLKVVYLNQKLDELKDAREADEEAARKQTAAQKEQARETQQYQDQVAGLTKRYEERIKAQQAALDVETKQLRDARAEQASIEQEFNTLVKEITAPEIDDVGLGDIFGKINQAAAAASRGQSELAVETAREGGELLKQLKEEGTESETVLGYLAERLKAVATEAAGANVKAEIIDEQREKSALNRLEEDAAAMKDKFVASGTEAAKSYVNAVQAVFDSAKLRPPKVAAPAVPAGAGTSSQRELEKRGPK